MNENTVNEVHREIREAVVKLVEEKLEKYNMYALTSLGSIFCDFSAAIARSLVDDAKVSQEGREKLREKYFDVVRNSFDDPTRKFEITKR